MHLSALVTALFASVAIASPLEAEAHIERRAAATCGTVSYSVSAVTAASQRACSNAASNNTPGGYPHQFNNREGFVFATTGPYLEFPILKSGSLYTGGSPGPDRVIITKSGCKEAGLITHTGAKGNAFLTCTVQQTKPSSGHQSQSVNLMLLSSLVLPVVGAMAMT